MAIVYQSFQLCYRMGDSSGIVEVVEVCVSACVSLCVYKKTFLIRCAIFLEIKRAFAIC